MCAGIQIEESYKNVTYIRTGSGCMTSFNYPPWMYILTGNPLVSGKDGGIAMFKKRLGRCSVILWYTVIIWIRDARVLSRLAKSNLIFEWHAYVDERVYTRIQYIESNILTCCLSIVRGLSGIWEPTSVSANVNDISFWKLTCSLAYVFLMFVSIIARQWLWIFEAAGRQSVRYL